MLFMFKVLGVDSDRSAALLASWQNGSLASVETSIRGGKELSLEELTALSTKFVESDTIEEKRKYFGLLDEISKSKYAKTLNPVSPIWGNGVDAKNIALAVDTTKLLNSVGIRSAYNFPTETSQILEKAYFRPETKDAALKSFEFFSMKPQCSISEATARTFVEAIIDPLQTKAIRESHYKTLCRLVKNDSTILRYGEKLFNSLLEQMKPLDPISGMKDFVSFGFKPSDKLLSFVITKLPEVRLASLFQKMQSLRTSISDANILSLSKYLETSSTARDALDSLCAISVYQEIPAQARIILCRMIDKPECTVLQTKIHETLSRGTSPFTDEMLALIAPEDKTLGPNSIKTLSSRGVLSERIVKHLADSIWDIGKAQAKSDAITVVKGLSNSSDFSCQEELRVKVSLLMYHERCKEDIKLAYVDSMLAQARKGTKLLEKETKFVAEGLLKSELEISVKLMALVKDELLVKGHFFVDLLAPNAFKRELFLEEISKFAEEKLDVEPIVTSNANKILKLRTASLVASSLDTQVEQAEIDLSDSIVQLQSAMEANHHFSRSEVAALESLLGKSGGSITKTDKEKLSSILAKVITHQHNVTSLKTVSVNILCEIVQDPDSNISLKFNACRSLNQLVEMRCRSAICPEVANSMALLVRVKEDPLKNIAIEGFRNFVELDAFGLLEEFSSSLVLSLPEIINMPDLMGKTVTSLYNLAYRGGKISDSSIEKLLFYSQSDELNCGQNERLSFLTIAHEAMNWNLIRSLAQASESGEDQVLDLKAPKYVLNLVSNITSMTKEMQVFVLKIINLHKIGVDDLTYFPAGFIENLIFQNQGEGIESVLRNEVCLSMSNLLMAGYIPSKDFGNILGENLTFESSGELLLLRSTIATAGLIASDQMIYGLSDMVATSGDSELVGVAIITLMTTIESRDKIPGSLDYTQIALDIEAALELEDKRLFAPIDEALEIITSKYRVKAAQIQTLDVEEAAVEVVEATESDKVSTQTKPRLRIDLIAELNVQNPSNEKIQSLISSGELERKLAKIDRFSETYKALDQSQIDEWVKTKGKSASTEEVIAIVDRANEIVMGGHRLRDTQKIAVLLLSGGDGEANLAQMKTGEGKTTAIAVTAIIKALQGKKVDIITSSPILAIEGATNKEALYNMFGLKVDHNYMSDYQKGSKECYEADIVYGASYTFQHDYLRHEYKKFNTRGDRDIKECFAIVDEVDSMMLDEKDKIAKIASHAPGMEYLAPLLSTIWVKALQMREAAHTLSALKSEIEAYGRGLLVEKIVTVPKHLEAFVNHQMSNWADSIMRAFSMSEEVDYVITTDGDGREVIAPIDFENTGVTQKNTSWQNGLHQFLQMKHGLEVRPETLTSSFISNMSFFRMYEGNLCGLTGTLGSDESRALLSKVYKVDTFEVPIFQESKLKILSGILCDNEAKWLEAITTRLHEEVDVRNGASLLICDSISSAQKIASAIEQAGIGQSLRLYTRSDKIEEGIADYITNGDIIVATNLAGRGTDIKTSPELEKVGGMYECTTFLPKNKRIADQAQGRTARQGNEGSSQLIINKDIVVKKYGGGDFTKIEEFEALRDRFERDSIARVEFTRIPKILAEDVLQKEFADFAEELHQIDGDKHKAASLEEKWGLWLKTHTSDDAEKFDEASLRSGFEDFKRKMRAEYSVIENPAYLTRKAYDIMASGEYAASYEYYEEAIVKDPAYGFIPAYNMGYAIIRENNRNSRFSDDKAPGRVTEHLANAKVSVDKAIITNRKILETTPEGTTTRAQIEAKIDVLEVQKSSIVQAQGVIAGMKKDQRIDIASHSKVHEILPEGPPYDSVVMEFAQSGLHIFYHLGAKPPPRDKGGMLVGMFAGALAAPFTAGLSVSLFGAGTISSATFAGFGTSLAGSLGSNIYSHKGRIDLGFRDSFKAKSLRAAALDGLSAGMFTGAVKGFKIGGLDKVTGVTRHTRIMQQHAVKAGVRVIVRGEKPIDALKSEAVNSATASLVNKTADIAKEEGYSTAFKAGMHGVAGTMNSLAQGGRAEQGFMAGLTTELVSGSETGEQLAAPITATVSMLMGGTEEDMARSVSIASTITSYNHKLHKDKSPDAPDEGEGEEEEINILNIKTLGDRGRLYQLELYESRIDASLEAHRTLPANLSSEDKSLISKLQLGISERYPELPVDISQEALALAFHAAKVAQARPEILPGELHTSAVVMPIARPTIEKVIQFVTTAAVGYVAGENMSGMARVVLDKDAATSFISLQRDILKPIAEDDISGIVLESSKGGSKNKSTSGTKVSASTPAPLKPDDDDGDKRVGKSDKTKSKFDPAKEGNFDKVSRHKRWGKFYRDVKDSNTWYSKEISGQRGHGGEHWKKFVQRGKRLYLEELVDTNGKTMNRIPGKKANIINISDLIGIK